MASSNGRQRRWRAGIWPSTPPPRPGIRFPGPVGLWENGAFLAYDLADGEGVLHDSRFRHPPPGTYAQQDQANARRFSRWQREDESARGEVYLELARVDLADVDAILDFASTFGVLDVRALDAPRMSRQWYGIPLDEHVPFRVLRHYPGFGDDGRHDALDTSLRKTVTEIADRQRAAAPTWVIGETIEEFRWGARIIRDLHTAWTCLSEPQDPRRATWANPRMQGALEDRDAEWQVTDFLERTMRDTLEGFSPRMWLVDDQHQRPSLRAITTPAPSDVTLFEILALELFRHIAENASYKRCANPACARVFVRQEGGAAHGQSRMTGVMYCTRRCAKAVAQRRYRQRHAQLT